MASVFLIFSKERLQNFNSRVHIFTCCAWTWLTFTDPNNVKQLGRPNFRYAERLVKFGLDLVMLWIHDKFDGKHNVRTNGQTNKQTNGQLPNLYKDYKQSRKFLTSKSMSESII